MSTKEFNERKKRAAKPIEQMNNAAKEIFESFLAEMYFETFASDFEKQNPEAFNEQFNSFRDEHSI